MVAPGKIYNGNNTRDDNNNNTNNNIKMSMNIVATKAMVCDENNNRKTG